MLKMTLRTLYIIGCSLLLVLPCHAAKWTTHFAYTNVTQIAMTPDKVFAISDGSLFSVDKQSEQIKVYNNQSGLHGTGINCIHYDYTGRQLIIGYANGKIDLLSAAGTQYVGALYDKDMTQRKTIYNVTIQGRTAYLSTHYGVQTMDLREHKLVDSYWLRPNGEETPVQDVLLRGDSIYAFAEDSLYCASLQDNLVDYTVWKREKRSSRISPDGDKGQHYQDGTDHWYASHGEGIVRFTPTARLTYRPQGPYVNQPYRLTAQNGQVWMVAGGRWTAQYHNAGHVMHYDGTQWTNITADRLKDKTGIDAMDMMNTAVDPKDAHHYFVTSYGTGLYEFDHDTLVHHFIASADNSIVSIIENAPETYTRLDYARYDAQGRLWFLDAALYGQLQCLDEQRQWHAVNLSINSSSIELHTPAGLIIDRTHPNYKWIATARYNTMLCLLDDHGTPFDNSDDQLTQRIQWTTTQGKEFKPQQILDLMQDNAGRIWMATEQGVAYIDSETDFRTSDLISLPQVMDNNGENPVTTQKIQALCTTPDGNIWIGSANLGVYVLNSAADRLVAHYTTDNSAMPSNSILSLSADENGLIWIGTAEGLVEYDPNGWGEGLQEEQDNDDASQEEEGSMLRWRLHFSYANPQQVAATPHHVFAVANGSLFSVDKADDRIVYWNKATGLNGTSVAHIAYDAGSGRLIIAYENGQIDLLDDQGNVTQMPDISMKAGSIAVTINHIGVGSRQTYLAMPFGIIALSTRKGEVSETYYIGSEAAAVDVQQVVEAQDSLFAFSYDRLYKASLNDNIVDYSFWQSETIPFEQVQQAVVYNNRIMVLAHDSLYRREGSHWSLVSATPLSWIHVSSNRLLAYQPNQGLFQLTDEDGWKGISNQYVAADAVLSDGSYWLAETDKGLVRLGTEGDDRFQPEGPLSNFGYHMDVAHNRVYVAPGGRWASEYQRQSSLSIYDGQQWIGIPWPDTWYYTDHNIRDAVSYAVDAAYPGHFYVATYGTGLFEFRDYKAVQHYDSHNSTLAKAIPEADEYYYTRTDGAMMDELGNLWVLNATTVGQAVHIMTPAGQWVNIPLRSGSGNLHLETPSGILVDQRHSQWKWMMDQRYEPKLILLDDGGTPTISSDDRCMSRSSFVDQNGNVLTPSNFRCIAQDHTNRIWIGTEKGLLTIPKEVDFFTSNACRRIIIPRNDGTGLGDYLLGDEQINCLAVDGGNRLWIGTANSGLYLIEDDTITVAHFTETNSLLPSNSVQSIAILPNTGEVFVGTDKGIASYRSDASEAQENMSHAYAYPNPVRPNYSGMISITGLMDNTVVNIIDAGGNLVCKTRSHGGTAVWDGNLPDGRRATPGVYTALCNAEGGHTVVKIMVIR